MKYHQLKIAVKVLAFTIASTHKEEKKLLGYARFLKGKFRKRHNKDQEKPTPPENINYPDDREKKMEEFYNKFQNLRAQRKQRMSKESRELQLAYGFLRGKDYSSIECDRTRSTPDFEAVLGQVLHFTDEDPRVLKQRFASWVDQAMKYITANRAARRKAEEAKENEDKAVA